MPTWIELISPDHSDNVRRHLVALGTWPVPMMCEEVVLGFSLKGHSTKVLESDLASIPGVSRVAFGENPHPKLSDWRGRSVQVGGAHVGPQARPVLMTGPCSVESEDQIAAIAATAASLGATFLRGGAFKPRSSPYSFKGLGEPALRWLRQAATSNGLMVVSEVYSEFHVDMMTDYVDLLQVGARNMQNFALLREVGRAQRPVLLKRAPGRSIRSWKMSAEHLLDAGADGVIFCERGSLASGDEVRNGLDISAIAHLAHVDGLSVIADVSHAAGRRDLLAPLSAASMAAGAHGVMLECHFDPARALSDGAQSADEDTLRAIAARVLPQTSESLQRSVGGALGEHSVRRSG